MSNSPPPIVVVCGLRQSNVGQIAGLLANAQTRYLLPELNLFMAEHIGALQLLFERSHDGLGDGLLRALAVLKSGRDDSTGVAQARDWLWRRQDWNCIRLLQELAEQLAPRQIVLPDRMLGWRPNYLNRLLTLENFRLVHVVRHPILHGRELAQALQQEAFIAPEWRDFCGDPSGVLDPQIAWYRFHRSLSNECEQDKVRYRRVRLEDIQAKPQRVMHQIANFLDWSDIPQIGELPDSPFLQTGSEAAPMGMERSSLLEPRLPLDLRPANPALSETVGWRDDKPRLVQEVQSLAQHFGYGIQTAL